MAECSDGERQWRRRVGYSGEHTAADPSDPYSPTLRSTATAPTGEGTGPVSTHRHGIHRVWAGPDLVKRLAIPRRHALDRRHRVQTVRKVVQLHDAVSVPNAAAGDARRRMCDAAADVAHTHALTHAWPLTAALALKTLRSG